MNTIQLTDAEFNEVRKAIEMSNDMMNDMCFDSLYIQPGSTKTFSSDELNAIREEIESNMASLSALKSALAKFGGETNDAGYAK